MCLHQTQPYCSADALHCISSGLYVIHGDFHFAEGSQALLDIILERINQQKKANQRESSSLFCVIIIWQKELQHKREGWRSQVCHISKKIKNIVLCASTLHSYFLLKAFFKDLRNLSSVFEISAKSKLFLWILRKARM